MDREVIIKALRCSASVPDKNHSCEGCSYRMLEEITEEDREQYGLDYEAGTLIDGKRYWESCDTEKMALDAAEMLEKTK